MNLFLFKSEIYNFANENTVVSATFPEWRHIYSVDTKSATRCQQRRSFVHASSLHLFQNAF